MCPTSNSICHTNIISTILLKVLKAACQTKNYIVAELILKTQLDHNIEVNPLAYVLTILTFARANKHEKAEEWIETMRQRGFKPNAACYAAALGGKPSKKFVKHIVEKMKKNKILVSPREISGAMRCMSAEDSLQWLFEGPPLEMTMNENILQDDRLKSNITFDLKNFSGLILIVCNFVVRSEMCLLKFYLKFAI